jgi:hypothetical protein
MSNFIPQATSLPRPADAVLEEAEVVSSEAQTKAARLREQQYLHERGAVLDQLPLNVRLGNARKAARRIHMDFSREERLIRHMVAGGRERNALSRMTTVEIRLRQRAASDPSDAVR